MQVINTMRDHKPISKAIEVMIISVQFLKSIQMSWPIVIAYHFLLLGIKADDGITCCRIFCLESGNVLKLRISILNCLHSLFLLSLTTTIVMLVQKLANHSYTNMHIIFLRQSVCYLC